MLLPACSCWRGTRPALPALCRCRSVGIAVPILPGIMPVMTYGGFKRMTAFCKTSVPKHMLDTVEAIKDNDEAVKVRRIEMLLKVASAAVSAALCGLLSKEPVAAALSLLRRHCCPGHQP
jgi:5,10-methylenetetrahydrofolate reductase